MSPLTQELLVAAFEQAELVDANQAIEAVRQARGDAVSYEVVLPKHNVDDLLLKKVLPKLVYFLDSRGESNLTSSRLFISLFTPERLYFLEVGPMVRTLAGARGLDAQELRRRFGVAGVGEPLQLAAK